jgi:hypothetical protein
MSPTLHLRGHAVDASVSGVNSLRAPFHVSSGENPGNRRWPLREWGPRKGLQVKGNSVGLKNYKFGRKNNWRRWQWNRVEELLEKHPRDAIALYLSGPDDVDRLIAKQKGFSDQNLIAVDANETNIQKIRRNGYCGIDLKLHEAIGFWKEPQVDVIIADYCSGLTFDVTWALMSALIFSPGLSHPCILSINLMRGRDAFSNELRGPGITKHRGKLFLAYFLGFYESARSVIGNGLPASEYINIGYRIAEVGQEERARILDRITIAALIASESFWSYKSSAGSIYMDSVVFKFRPIFSGIDKSIKTPDYGPKINKIGKTITAKLAALKAWRTRRGPAPMSPNF